MMVQISVGLFVAAVVLFVYFAASHKVAREGRVDLYGDRVITNEGGFVWLPTARRTLDLSPRPITTTAGPLAGPDSSRITLVLDADVSFPTDHASIRTAAGHFAGAEHTVDPVAGELIEEAASAVVAQSTGEDLADWPALADKVLHRATPMLGRLGLQLDWLTISSLTTGSDELIAR